MSPVFGGGGSIQLARVFGIRVGVEPSWFIVLFLIIWSLSGYYGDLLPDGETKAYALAVVSALLFFGSVLLHELGHAVVAMRNGIGIAGIDLWMFGGVARMDRDSDSAGVELRVAVGGPAVTLLIAAACFTAGTVLGGSQGALDSTRFDLVAGDEVLAVLGWLTFVNGALLVFNLIPGFPLDGGRIARALVWWKTGDRARATLIAARLGRGIAYLMIGVGVLIVIKGDLVGGIWLAFVGMFLSQAARQAELESAATGPIEGVSVGDVMDSEPIAIPQTLDLERAFDEFFARYGYPWFPVVDDGGALTGLVAREAVQSIPTAEWRSTVVASVMARDEEASSDLRVRSDDPLEALLTRDSLRRLGAVLAVDADGVLRGIVTVDDVRRALTPAEPVGS